MKHINQVVIVPSAGWSDELGGYSNGLTHGKAIEAQLTYQLGRLLKEELEYSRTPVKFLDNFNAPGYTPEQRIRTVPPKSIVIQLSVGESPKDNGTNKTAVHYGDNKSRDFANGMLDAVAEWGRCINFGHQRMNVRPSKADPLLTIPDTIGIKLEPFLINGAEIETYLDAFPSLAKVIANFVTFYSRETELNNTKSVLSLGGSSGASSGPKVMDISIPDDLIQRMWGT